VRCGGLRSQDCDALVRPFGQYVDSKQNTRESMYGPGDACSGNWPVRSEVLRGLQGLQGALLSTGRDV
jgi:hypothetical protein